MTKGNKSNSNLTKPNSQNAVRVQRTELYAGPLPPPDILAKFEQILPGAADRILKQAETQTQHRIEIEKMVVSSDIKKSFWGLIFGFVLGLSGIGSGVFLATLGFNVFGPLLSGGSLITLVAVFIYGTRSRKQEREKRFEKLSK